MMIHLFACSMFCRQILAAMLALTILMASCRAMGGARRRRNGDVNPAPPGFRQLLVGNVDSRGVVLRPPNLTLTEPGAVTKSYPPLQSVWYHGGTTLTFNQTYSDYGSYIWTDNRTVCGSSCVGVTWTPQTFELHPNRKYIVAAVIRTSFPRDSTEINLGMYYIHNGSHMNMSRFGGLPNSTARIDGNVDGWYRWEWEVVTAQDSRIQAGAMAIHVYAPASGQTPGARHPVGP